MFHISKETQGGNVKVNHDSYRLTLIHVRWSEPLIMQCESNERKKTKTLTATNTIKRFLANKTKHTLKKATVGKNGFRLGRK